MAILSSDPKPLLPPETRLESTCVALEDRKESRNLVRFVERWAELGRPSPRARLAQARAFYDLRLLDRATIRLRELTEHDDYAPDALKLLGQCFLMRGWPVKARQPLEQARKLAPDDIELEALLQSTEAAPSEPTDGSEESSDAEILRETAEYYLATGSFLKAQTLLERSRRIRPNNKRAADLLWGLAGDYSSKESLPELCMRWGPDIHLDELSDEAENTESITLSNVAGLDLEPPDASDSQAFPALFRNLDAPDPGAFDASEVTQASSIASIRQLQEGIAGASSEGPTTVENADDTQIAHVIRNHGDLPGPAEDTTGRVPGMPFSQLQSDFDPGLEEEDDDLIILTGKEDSGAHSAAAPGGLPLDPDPTTSEVIGQQVVDLLDRVRADMPSASEAPTQINDTETPDAEKKRKRKRRASGGMSLTWWFFVLGGVFMLGAFALAFLAIITAVTG